MFAGIAPRYDLLNHLLSLNIDRSWRHKVADELRPVLDDPEAVVLDVACGTGDLSIELARGSKAKILGTDFCRPMLAIARQKSPNIPYIEADALSLPVPDESAAALTIAFGLRNLANFAQGLSEFARVLKPGGRLVVLECSKPIVPGFGFVFDLYFSQVLPRIGGAVSGKRSAYEYLPNSVKKFPKQKDLVRLIESCGFRDVTYRNLAGGVVAIHSATR
jgi:demethylmenaquinone methyltransferase / 2-methoxy-6-polyprenyl-1,4-benzoquinol methylase